MTEEVKEGSAYKAVSSYLGDPEKISQKDQKWFMQVGENKRWIPVGQVVLYNPERDTCVAVGWREEPAFKFQGPILAEPKGGGEVCLLYFLAPTTNEVWVGAVLEDRKNMGGKNICAIGGMNELRLNRDEVLRQELSEEAGLKGEAFKPFPLKGQPVNGNRLFFLANAKKKEGVRFSALEVPEDCVEVTSAGKAKFKDGVVSDAESEVIFMPWYLLSRQSSDALLQAGITRLMAHLHEEQTR